MRNTDPPKPMERWVSVSHRLSQFIFFSPAQFQSNEKVWVLLESTLSCSRPQYFTSCVLKESPISQPQSALEPHNFLPAAPDRNHIGYTIETKVSSLYMGTNILFNINDWLLGGRTQQFLQCGHFSPTNHAIRSILRQVEYTRTPKLGDWSILSCIIKLTGMGGISFAHVYQPNLLVLTRCARGFSVLQL